MTDKVKGPNGRMIAAYRLPTTMEEAAARGSGRRAFSKKFKQLLVTRYEARCALCSGRFPANVLQIDHRVPYAIGGDPDGERNPDAYMLLCPSCNRTKSWTCEHCTNWLEIKEPTICNTCLFGSPADYTHIATEAHRRLSLNWSGEEVADYDDLKRQADAAGQPLEQFARGKLRS